MGKSAEATYCTVELNTGSFVEVAATPQETLADLRSDGLIKLPRLGRSGRADADYREDFWLRGDQVVAVYPLDEVPYRVAQRLVGD